MAEFIHIFECIYLFVHLFVFFGLNLLDFHFKNQLKQANAPFRFTVPQEVLQRFRVETMKCRLQPATLKRRRLAGDVVPK